MLSPSRGRLRIGIDTGGTFTDVVAVDERTAKMIVTKVPSTPANPALGTNALLQGNIDSLGLIVTEGFSRHAGYCPAVCAGWLRRQ